MSTLLPDCGVLNSPSTSSPFARSLQSLSQSRKSLECSTTSPARLGEGMAVCFYQSPKVTTPKMNTSTTSRSPYTPPSFRNRRLGNQINRGVGHGIKKTKMRAKSKKPANPAKVSVRRLKQVKPPPRLPEHRIGPNIPSSGKRRHQLSSPGISLLDSLDTGSEFMAGSRGDSKVFFTSRARAAATVQITKNVLLSVSYGNISLQQRGAGVGLKRNIGGASPATEQTLPVAVGAPRPAIAAAQDSSPLSASSGNDNHKPIRFVATPSPLKRKLAVQQARQQQKENVHAIPTISGLRSSPRRMPLLSKNSSCLSPSKVSRESTESMSTSRILEMTTSARKNTQSPGKKTLEVCLVRCSPRRLAAAYSIVDTTPTKKLNSTPQKLHPIKSTPTKSVLPRREIQLCQSQINERNVVINMVHMSPSSKSASVSPTKQLLITRQELQSPVSSSPLKALMLSSVDSRTKNIEGSPRRIMVRNSPLRNNQSPSKFLQTPSKSNRTPSKSNRTPSKSTGTPSKSTGTPSKSTGTPSKSAGTPSKSTGTPSKSTGTPSKSTGTPSKSTGTPSKSTGTPSKSVATQQPFSKSEYSHVTVANHCQSPGTATNGTNTNVSPKVTRSLRSTPQKVTPTSFPTELPMETDTPSEEMSCSQGHHNSADMVMDEGNCLNGNYFPVFHPEKRRSFTKEEKLKSSTGHGGVWGNVGDSEQRVLDAGQKAFGATQCAQCGLVYEIGDPDDDLVHRKHHQGYVDALTYRKWKNERQVSHPDSNGGRVIMIVPDDPSYCWRKVEQVAQVVDEELGFSGQHVSVQGHTWTVFLYIVDSTVVGCLVAEKIKEAYRVVPSDSSDNDTNSQDSFYKAVLCCSTHPEHVHYGISRIWVKSEHRLKGIAAKLVDTFRGNVIPYVYLKIDTFAFSDPTPSGMQFARSYTKKQDFLVYRNIGK